MPRLNDRLKKSEYKQIKRRFDTGRIYMAEVMDTRNVSKSGEILVHVIGSGLNKEDSRNWIVANYASNFFGTTPHDKNLSPDYTLDPKSFGAWFPMPCVGNYVFIFFPVSTGENTNAFWFACPVNPSANYMVPGIPSKYDDKSDEHCPLCERNDKSYSLNDNKKFNQNIIEGQTKQAVYEPLNEALKRQGLNKDGIRGYSTSGAKRESPSMCYGILTPMGNSFVIDDGWTNDDNKTIWNFKCNDTDKNDNGDINQIRKLVGSDGKCPWQRTYEEEQTDEFRRKNAGFRFRTRNGTQILIADEGTIYMINADGSCWVEMTKNGYLECWSEKGVSVGSEGDINLHAMGNIYIEAGGKIAMKGRDMNIETVGDIDIYNTKHINTEASISATELLAENGNISTFESSGAQIMGTFTGTLDGTAYYATYSGAVPELQPAALVYDPDLIKPKEQQKYDVDGKGYNKEDVQKYGDTINTKITSKEPYYGHCNSVDSNEIQDNISTPIPSTNNNCKGCNKSIGTNQANSTSNNNVTNQVCKNPATNKVDRKPVGENIPEMQLSEHFTLRQLCYSDTANRNHIKNVPTETAIQNLKYLAENILEPIYKEFDGRVQINSGYRGPQVNALVGSKNSSSQHTVGQAVDVEVPGITTWDLCMWIRDNLDYDQLILENCTNLKLDPNSGWVHCSYNNVRNRKEELTIKNGRCTSGFHR